MLFTEALEALKNGSYVTRTAWTDGGYLAFLPNMQYIWKVQLMPNIGAGNWLPMLHDLCADDWTLLVPNSGVVVETPPVADAPVLQ